MASAPDLMGVLSLDPCLSQSPFGGNCRFILVKHDFSNSTDFVFNTLLQHFGKREPNSRILLVTLSHSWLNYSVSAAKCGYNLRKRQNNVGNIDVLSIMDKHLEDTIRDDDNTNYCDYIYKEFERFIGDLDNDSNKSPVVMIDDLSILLTIGCSAHDVFKLVLNMDRILRSKSERLPKNRLNHLIVQTMFLNFRTKLEGDLLEEAQLNFLLVNLENISDMCITLKPLETGHSTRVDGTIKFVDNRVPLKLGESQSERNSGMLSNILSCVGSADIGSTRAYFYKLSDRRVRLTSDAFIF